MKETNKATNEKLDNVIAQSDLDHAQIIDNTERIDRIDRNKTEGNRKLNR